jgi:uncharacterized protein
MTFQWVPANDDRRLQSIQPRWNFAVLRRSRAFVFSMAFGSIVGAGFLLGRIDAMVLHPLRAIILLLSAVKVWRHE